MVSVNTAVNLTVTLLRVICLQMLSSLLLLIYGSQQLLFEVTGMVSFVIWGYWICGWYLEKWWEILGHYLFKYCFCPIFSFLSLLSLTPTLSCNFSIFLCLQDFLWLFSFELASGATKFFLQLCLVYRSLKNLVFYYYIFQFWNFHLGPDWCGSVGCPTNRKVAGSIPSQGTCQGCRPGPHLGARKRWSMFLSLSFLPLSSSL